MTTQTNAQRLAAKMKSYKLASGYAWHCHKAGDELRRLEAANAELLEALRQLLHDDSEQYAWEVLEKHGGAA